MRLFLLFTLVPTLYAAAFTFSTGGPTNSIAMATRPDSTGVTEIEAADDFVTTTPNTNITGGSIFGVLNSPTGAPTIINSLDIEIYRVFPLDSNVARTSGPPTFSTSQVPTRVNSPSDVALTSRASTSGQLTFAVSTISANFSVLNSVQPGGITLATGGGGAVSGTEVRIDFTLSNTISLDAGHYFFVPQVQTSNGNFLWLSGSRPISGAGTTPFMPDLQAWIRDAALDPDWMRVGTDIVGGSPAPTFNAAFVLVGNDQVPEPGTAVLLLGGLAALAIRSRRLTKA